MSAEVLELWDSLIQNNASLTDVQYKFRDLTDVSRTYTPAAFNDYAEKHRGQIKLFETEALVIASALMVEVKKAEKGLNRNLTKDEKKTIMKNTVVLYTGGTAISNSHCKELGQNFPYVQFHLYDPRHMDVSYLNKKNPDFETNVSESVEQFVFHQEYFQKSTVEQWFEWKKVNPTAVIILINDIRSDLDWDTSFGIRDCLKVLMGLFQTKKYYNLTNFLYVRSIENLLKMQQQCDNFMEHTVARDSMLEQEWVSALQADYSLSKMRKTWPSHLQSKDTPDTNQLKGELLIQAYAANASTELRLFVVRQTEEISRFVVNGSFKHKITKIHLKNDVNDVEIHPRFEINQHGWKNRIDEDGLKLTTVSEGFGLMAVDSQDVETKMFNYNMKNSENDYQNDQKLRNLTLCVVENMRNLFEFDSLPVSEPLFPRRNGSHATHKKVRLQKDPIYDKINAVQECFDNGQDWKPKWQNHSSHADIELENAKNIIDTLKSKISKIISDQNKYVKFKDEDKRAPTAPVFFIRDVILAKLKLYTHLNMKKYAMEEIDFDVKDEWLHKHVLAHLLYYNPPTEWIADKKLWKGLNMRLQMWSSLENSAEDELKCWIPGVVLHEYHKAPRDFFKTRYWAITMYRQFMHLLKPNIELDVPAIEMSQQHFKQWIEAYVDEEGYLATESKPKTIRFLLNWPWKNPWLHAAVRESNLSMVINILNFNTELTKKYINYQRKRDGNTAITLAYWVKNQNLARSEKEMNNLIIKAIMQYNPDMRIANFYDENANKFKEMQEQRDNHGSVEQASTTWAGMLSPKSCYFISIASEIYGQCVVNPFMVEL